MQTTNRVVCQSMMRETVWDGAEGGFGEQMSGTLWVAEEFARTDQFMSESSSDCSQLAREQSPASALRSNLHLHSGQDLLISVSLLEETQVYPLGPPHCQGKCSGRARDI